MKIDNDKRSEYSKLQLLTELEVADLLKWSPKTLRKARLLQRGPRFVRIGRSIRYKLTDLAEYIDSRPSGGFAA